MKDKSNIYGGTIEVKQTSQFEKDFEQLRPKQRVMVRGLIYKLNRDVILLNEENTIHMQGTDGIDMYIIEQDLVLVFKRTHRTLYLIRVSDTLDLYEWSIRSLMLK